MLTLQLTPETERRLRRAAEKAGKSVETFVEEVFAALPLENENSPAETPVQTGAQLLQALATLNLSGEYGDMSLSAEDYARQLRADSNRSRHA